MKIEKTGKRFPNENGKNWENYSPMKTEKNLENNSPMKTEKIRKLFPNEKGNS